MNEGEFDSRGLSIEPVYGLRSFLTTPDGSLTGIFHPQVWVDGHNEARCYKNRKMNANWDDPIFSDAIKHCQMDECKHGFYAYYDEAGVHNGSWMTSGKRYATGVIQGFGTVLIGSKGFRCTKAIIVAVSISTYDEIRDKVAEKYHVPMFASMSDMALEFPCSAG